MRELTTTSYSILCLLALRPWSAYELTKQVQRSLAFAWPRAATRIYQEPKNLVEHGLAAAAVEATGKRTRTVYSITDAGREALAKWLEQPSEPNRLESEALLRTGFAELGTKEGLLRTLAGLEAEARATRAQAAAQAAEYVDGAGPMPDRAHVISLVGRYVLLQADLTVSWAQWAQEEVAGWPDTRTVAPSAIDGMRAALESIRLDDGPLSPPGPAGTRSRPRDTGSARPDG